MAQLQGKWALVTGSSRGVGRHISLSLAKLGCNLVLHSRDLGHTDSLLAEVKSLGVQAFQVAGELSDQSQVDLFLDATLKGAPQIDIVYNNAAIMAPYCQNPWTGSAEDFRRSFEINVISLVRICHRLVPPMLKRKWGRVVNVSSGIKDQPELTAYAISKAAVDKFVRDFAPSLKGTGVQMDLLDPGWLRTDLGGPNAPNDPSTVIPGALVPALLNDGKSGRFFHAQDFAGLTLEKALEKGLLQGMD
jgi:NAD(P)-dependent dehydrogenase (short-subunit alcohol dehydrogenase family)